MKFDNTHEKVKRSRTRPFVDYGVHDEPDFPPASTASTSQEHETGGGGDEPNGDIAPEAEFSITINGTASTQDSEGTLIPASVFTLGCLAGTYTLTHPNVQSASSDTVTKEISLGTSLSADFTVSDGDKIYIVYGKIKYVISASGYITDISNDSTIVAIDADSNTDKQGWDKEAGIFTFKIGTVTASKRGSQRRVFVNQIQSGSYLHGFTPVEPQPPATAFQIVPVTVGNNNYVYVAPGSVNGVFATGTNVNALRTSTVQNIWLKVDLDESTQLVTSCSITGIEPTASFTVAKYGIGSYSDTNITQGVIGSLSLTSCGPYHYFSF